MPRVSVPLRDPRHNTWMDPAPSILMRFLTKGILFINKRAGTASGTGFSLWVLSFPGNDSKIFVGHRFSRAVTPPEITRLYRLRKKSGRDFVIPSEARNLSFFSSA